MNRMKWSDHFYIQEVPCLDDYFQSFLAYQRFQIRFVRADGSNQVGRRCLSKFHNISSFHPSGAEVGIFQDN